MTVRRWGKKGIIKTYPYNDRNGCLFEHPGVNSPLMKKGHNNLNISDFKKNDHSNNQEVQYEN